MVNYFHLIIFYKYYYYSLIDYAVLNQYQAPVYWVPVRAEKTSDRRLIFNSIGIDQLVLEEIDNNGIISNEGWFQFV